MRSRIIGIASRFFIQTRTRTTMSSAKLESKRPKQSPEADPSTLSNYQHFSVPQTDISLNVNWNNQTLSGLVSYSLEAKDSSAEAIELDSSYVDVNSVQINGKDVPFELTDRVEPFGNKLVIKSGSIAAATQTKVDIAFSTTKDCTALQWLEPEQTAGKVAPYLFSQCQAIHARSLFPCFDTPAIKSKFNVTIKSLYPALASGNVAKDDEKTPEPIEGGEGKLWRFVQSIPIPSYLFAIASGDLKPAEIGPRSHVWCEPCKLDAAKWEYEADTEKIIQAAESIVFPYPWGQYDILNLPPSFPYGGMENPNITFATPTLISGDRQNVNVIAHELAHSWSGNLVTNCSWEHFWLNEGWTVYLERRILGALNGEAFRHFHAIIGWQELEHSIQNLTDGGNAQYTQLVVDLQGNKDPDDAFSTVPYEKGFNFLFMLENTLGKENWDKFIPHYFAKYKGQSLDSYQFKDTIYNFFQDQKDTLDKIDWDAWYYQPGLPPKPQFDTSLADACYKLADKWVAATESQDFSGFSKSDLEGWTSTQSCVFIDTVANKFESVKGEAATTAATHMNELYSFSSSSNPEVISRWYRLAVPAHVSSQYQPLANWLGTVGRMKFVRPGYRLLNNVDRDLALKTFEDNRTFYHPICKAMVIKDLGLDN